jgi:hypothetical protein
MASVKKFNGNLIIQTPYKTGVTSNITLDSDNVIITGNLTILGNSTTIVSNNTSIDDNILTLNYGETGPGVTLGTAGIAIARGSLANVSLIWRENIQKWQITSDGSTYGNILTSSSAGIANVQADPTPTLGANLQVAGFNVIFNNANAVPPTLVNNATVVYGSTPGGGTAGVYVLNGAATGQELITTARAFGFSLIL